MHLRPHLATARPFAALLVDIAVLHPGVVALVVVEEEEVQTTIHTFPEPRIRDRDHQHPDVVVEAGHTRIRGRGLEHHRGGEADHHPEVRQGEDGEARAIARTAVIAAVGAGAGVDRSVGEATFEDDRHRSIDGKSKGGFCFGGKCTRSHMRRSKRAHIWGCFRMQ